MHARHFPYALTLAFALALGGGTSAAATFDLVAVPFVKAMPVGGPVLMWGYALDGPNPVATVPGPPLVVPAGDATLTVNLRNALGEPVSLVIPGQPLPVGTGGAALPPVKFTDDQGRQRVRSFTAEAAPGGTQTYVWNNLKPGTYLYHSGSHPQLQVQMGLYGAVKHDASAGAQAEAYPGTPYDTEVTVLLSEVDPVLHAAVQNNQYGPGLAVTSTIDYAPRWFLVNGEAHPATSLTLPAGAAGQRVLLRMLNAGLQSRSLMLQGQHFRVLAEDGRPYPFGREQYSAFLPALKTLDAVFTPVAAGTLPLYDRRGGTANPAMGGHSPGGMLAFLKVADPDGKPLAGNDAWTTDEDTPLQMAAPGVLANDDAGTTARMLTGPAHGSVTLAPDGSFTYTPLANYAGADSFTYQAVLNSVGSLAATVSLTINPVNDAPVAAANAYTVTAGTTLNVAAPGVLGNDSDAEGSALTAVNASALAGLTFQPDGSFSYAAPATTGSQTFTYQASDGVLASAPATVTLNVVAATNAAPVAVDDNVTAPRRGPGAYTPAAIEVLANDTDADGNLYPATVSIVTPPNKGGVVSVVGNGTGSVTVHYTPKLNFRGSENFSYRVRDSAGATSNTATVRVNVK